MRAMIVTTDTARERQDIYRVGQAMAYVLNATPCLKASQVQVCSLGAFGMHISAHVAIRMHIGAMFAFRMSISVFVLF